MCERIPTIGTQLKILSTVKATMLGAQGRGCDYLSPLCIIPGRDAVSELVWYTYFKASTGYYYTSSFLKLFWLSYYVYLKVCLLLLLPPPINHTPDCSNNNNNNIFLYKISLLIATKLSKRKM